MIFYFGFVFISFVIFVKSLDSDVFNYFRGVVAKNEKSIRVLMLCRDALTLSPANYTVWQYRYKNMKN